ncbi:MAG: ATP-binding protein, partial [Treponema sp.]|nr:ATP-binding protein [Treponema sp.]
MKTTFTDSELESFLDDNESDRAERKQSYSDDVTDKIRQTVCAFSNDFPTHNEPGIIFIGALD